MNASFALSSPIKLRSALRFPSPMKRRNFQHDEDLENIDDDDAVSMHFDDLVDEAASIQSKLDNEMNESMSSMSFSTLGSSFHSSSTKFMDSVRNLKLRRSKPDFGPYDELPEESSGDVAREMQKGIDEDGSNYSNSTIDSDWCAFNHETSKLSGHHDSTNIEFDDLWSGKTNVEVTLSPLQKVVDVVPTHPARQASPTRKKRPVPRDNAPRTPRRNRYVRYRRSDNEVDVTHHVRSDVAHHVGRDMSNHVRISATRRAPSTPHTPVDPEAVLERCRSPHKSRREQRKVRQRSSSVKNHQRRKRNHHTPQHMVTTNTSMLHNSSPTLQAQRMVATNTSIMGNNDDDLQRHRPLEAQRSINADAGDLGRIGSNGRYASTNDALVSPHRNMPSSTPRLGNSWGDSSFGRLDLKCLEKRTSEECSAKASSRQRVQFDFDPKNIKSVLPSTEKATDGMRKTKKLTMVKKNFKVLRAATPQENLITLASN